MTDNLEDRFHNRMLDIYDQAKAECGYNATRFRQLVHSMGGLAAAKSLLHGSQWPQGLTRLWQAGRLDISMEATVIQDPWCQLFSPEELVIARKRLRELGQDIP